MTLRPETRLVSIGRPAHEEDAPLNPPIVLTSTYVGAGDPAGLRSYARSSSPTWDPFESALADLEGSEQPALLYSSGVSAIAAVLSLVPTGGTLLLPRHVYTGTAGLARSLATRQGFEVTVYDADDDAATLSLLAEADAERTLLWIESPTNPMMEICDLPRVLAESRRLGVLSAVDNTFATPLVQRPLEHGADVVVHSVTKYLAGHSDVVLGAAVPRTAELRETLLGYRTMHGSIAGPFEAWLALRGLRTLSVRVERSQGNAAELASRLAEHPAVTWLRHPSLPHDPSYEVASRTMDGFGSVICLCPVGGVEEAEAFVRATRLWTPATSLGGVESTLERRFRHPGEPETVPKNLVRLSVGIENVEDLWADLDSALRQTL